MPTHTSFKPRASPNKHRRSYTLPDSWPFPHRALRRTRPLSTYFPTQSCSNICWPDDAVNTKRGGSGSGDTESLAFSASFILPDIFDCEDFVIDSEEVDDVDTPSPTPQKAASKTALPLPMLHASRYTNVCVRLASTCHRFIFPSSAQQL